MIDQRVLNAKTAAHYLGMSQSNFNEKVRPFVTEVPEAANKISFDRLDLDNWWEQHKQANGKPAKANWSNMTAPMISGLKSEARSAAS